MCGRGMTVAACLLLAQCAGWTAFERQPIGGRERACGGAATARGTCGMWLEVNPAGVCEVREPYLSASISPAILGIPELREWALGAGFVAFGLDAGCVVRSLQAPGYAETSCRCAFGIALAGVLDIGLSGAVHLLTIAGYGRASAVSLDAGFVYHAGAALSVGGSIRNLSGSRIGKARDPIPVEARVGLAYRPAKGLEILIDGGLDARYPPVLLAGVAFAPVDALELLVGADPARDAVSGGAGLKAGSVSLYYAASSHAVLGLSHHLTVAWMPEGD